MSNDAISVRRQEAVYRIELNRPDCGNLVTMQMVGAIADALRSVPGDVKLVTIRGRGTDFCRGRDYQSAPESARDGRTPAATEILERMTTPVLEAYSAIKECALPTLAVVQGAAYGFGCALAAGCDIVLAGESSRFRFPEMNRGLPPTLAMHAIMDHVTSRALAHLIYSAAEFDARAALAMGLASAVFPDAELEREVSALSSAVSSYPIDSVKAVKSFLKHGPVIEPRARAEMAANLFANVLSSR